MSKKTIQTKIITRNDEVSNWESSSVVLAKGELALGLTDKGYELKVGAGAGTTYKNSTLVRANAADVHEWAKAPQLAYDALPSTLTNSVENSAAKLDGINSTVVAHVSAAINALDVEDAAQSQQLVSAVNQTDGKISVTRRILTAADIPTLAMSKVSGLTDLKTDVENLQDALETVKTVMSFEGAVPTKPAGTDGYQDGDVILVTSTGLEYVCYNNEWVEIGNTSATDDTVARLIKAVFTENTIPSTGAAIEARLEAVEDAVGLGSDVDGDAVITRVENLETQAAVCPTGKSTLEINQEIIIFDCGTATIRDGLDQ